MRFRVVSIQRQLNAYNLLRNTPLCRSGNPQIQIIRRKGGYMVIGSHDVRDDGGIKSIQDNKGGRTNKNNKRLDKDPLICAVDRIGQLIFIFLSAEKPRSPAMHPRADRPQFFQKIS